MFCGHESVDTDVILHPEGRYPDMLSEILITVLNLLVASASGAVLFLITKSGEVVIAGAKTAAEEGTKAAIKIANWPIELRQEIEKSRGLERQELRFKSYGDLWKRLRPLAIYSVEPVNRASLRALSDDLSDWYFSECGGMFLLPHARESYFALQDFARAVGAVEDWECGRYDGPHREIFGEVLTRFGLNDALRMREALSATDLRSWPGDIEKRSKGWRKDIEQLAARWGELDERQRFAIIQQIGSVLRTNLVNDVESRLR